MEKHNCIDVVAIESVNKPHLYDIKNSNAALSMLMSPLYVTICDF